MKFSLFSTLLVVSAASVNAQFGVIMTDLAQFASTLTTVIPFLRDPIDQPMRLVSSRDEGNIHLVTATPGHYNMNINFMFDGSNFELALPLAAYQQIQAGKSLKEMETYLQTIQTSDKYTSTYFVPKGLQYQTGSCNRKYIKFCDFTYDMYISIGQSKGWGWNEAELKRQSQEIVKNQKRCAYERLCPAN